MEGEPDMSASHVMRVIRVTWIVIIVTILVAFLGHSKHVSAGGGAGGGGDDDGLLGTHCAAVC